MEPQPAKLLPAEQELMHERLQVQPQKLYAELIKSKSLESVCINNSPLQQVDAIVALLFLLSCMLADLLELFASCEVLKKMFSQVLAAPEFLQHLMKTFFSDYVWEVRILPQNQVIAAPHCLPKGCMCHASTVSSKYS